MEEIIRLLKEGNTVAISCGDSDSDAMADLLENNGFRIKDSGNYNHLATPADTIYLILSHTWTGGLTYHVSIIATKIRVRANMADPKLIYRSSDILRAEKLKRLKNTIDWLSK